MHRCFFFDMDGVLFDSMPFHAKAWVDTMHAYGFPFTSEDAYRFEGRTGKSVIDDAYMSRYGRHATEDEWQTLYAKKTQCFRSQGEAKAIPGIHDILAFLRSRGVLIFIVTGSGQQSLLNHLNHEFPGIFTSDCMITARDVERGKPDPEPYLKAYAKACTMVGDLTKEQCVVIENAPLGVRSGHAAGFEVYAVNTGPLPDDVLSCEGANHVYRNMHQLLDILHAES